MSIRLALLCVLIGVSAASNEEDAGRASNSLAVGTLVLTDTGMRRIETMQVGDRVWGYNAQAGKSELHAVVNVTSGTASSLFRVAMRGGVTVSAVAGHPVFVKGKGWIAMQNVAAGSVVRQMTGSGATVRSVKRLHGLREVFRIEVENVANYYATRARLLVGSGQLGDNSPDGLQLNSFVAGTLVFTEHGRKRIETIQRGDGVLGFNEERGTVEVHVVKAVTHRTSLRATKVIFFDGESVTATPEHLLFTEGGRWLPVAALRPGNVVQTHSGRGAVVRSLVPVPGERIVFDLQVDVVRNYFVSSAGLLASSAGPRVRL